MPMLKDWMRGAERRKPGRFQSLVGATRHTGFVDAASSSSGGAAEESYSI